MIYFITHDMSRSKTSQFISSAERSKTCPKCKVIYSLICLWALHAVSSTCFRREVAIAYPDP